jgi:uncharacterized protein HemX
MTEKKKTTSNKQDTKSTTGAKLGLAASVVGAIAAGYYLYGPKGAQNRQKVQAWTLKAKAEVLERFEKAKEVTEETYTDTVDKVTAKYAKMKNIGEEEAKKLNAELKRHWKSIKKAAEEKPSKKKK